MAMRDCWRLHSGVWRAAAAVFMLSFALLAMVSMGARLAYADTTTRVSVDSTGTQGDSGSNYPRVSADGRYVAFHSDASNLVDGDTNAQSDVFVRDTATDTTTRVSVDTTGTQGNGGSYHPRVSADGRYVAFYSNASNLVDGDTNAQSDVFVRDTATDTTTRVSVHTTGTQGNGGSYYCSISADGRYVTFHSHASNLVAGDTNGQSDIFVRDTVADTTTRVSVDSDEVQGNNWSEHPSISGDGRYVAFYSYASNLVPSDTNDSTEVFVRDTVDGTTMRVAVDSAGTQGNGGSYYPSVSSNGRYVAFYSGATNLVAGDTNGQSDIFVRDIVADTTTRVSVGSAGAQGNSESVFPSISADGRYVAFRSASSNLVDGDTNGAADVFVRDVVAGTTARVSIDSAGAQGNSGSDYPSISADGSYVAFYSDATNLVDGDTNGAGDVFLRDATDTTPPTTTISTLPVGWTGEDVDFSLEATDPAGSGVAHTYYGLNASAVTTYATTVTVNSEGTTTINYRSVDASGNAETTKTATVRIDKTDPVTTDDHAASYQGAATIQLSASDAMSGVAGTRYSLDSGAVTTGTTVSAYGQGAHTLAYSSVDAAGNAETTKTVSFAIAGGTAKLVRSTHMALTGRANASAGRSYRLKLWVSPRPAPGYVRMSIRCVSHGRTVTKKTVTVRLVNGMGVYRFKPYYHGTWEFTARYYGGSTSERVFRPCSATKSVTVR